MCVDGPGGGLTLLRNVQKRPSEKENAEKCRVGRKQKRMVKEMKHMSVCIMQSAIQREVSAGREGGT